MTFNKKILSASLVIGLLSSSAFALEIPKGGVYDKRVKFISYNQEQVVKLVGHYGYSTNIQFAPGENVTNIAMGDPDAWEVAPVANHIFIKPTGEKAATNMTVLTDRRVYTFELSAVETNKRTSEMFFQVNFRYPQDEAKLQQFEENSRKLKLRLNEKNPNAWTNWNYWVFGSREISPWQAYDDGRFTYFKFSGNSSIPAVYIKHDDGSETLLNPTMDADSTDTMIVEKVAAKFVLRKGHYVVNIFNESYSPHGIINTNGTTSPGVKRVIRGGE
ncbi:P-type conjugative transfer protein VirB9 [Xenorhabdus sp. KK7.4]|uniref:P-type conjugative transfer protein VirB9 n=1 Tax=Xenorhabdus sp. KK7.4 TaxID=1851572 RepID=UPI000C053B60|nr:P-type conjugative transfer protein VirB9 [Xenorhabdus sp. KK7.4]PHM51289.1 Type IV secretion system CagX conjugation protein [Xenorhabdus sp. KK7.4]